MSAEPSIIDWDALIRGTRISGRLYRDPEVFEHEIEDLMSSVDNYLDFRLSPDCPIR